MKKIAISPLSQKVVKAYDDGQIELLFSREVKVGKAIPFIIRKNEKGNIVATIFISTFATLDANSNLAIPVKQLYALMESAYVALRMQINPAVIQRDTVLMKIVNSVYTQIFLRVLNKEYALSLDKELYDKTSYCINKFFLSTVWGYPSKDLVEAYAKSDLKSISELDLGMISTAYDSNNIKDINELISFISDLSPRMKELNTRYFIERFINMYHGSSIMSIDYLPYTFFVIINVILGSFLIAQNALNDIIKNTKGINKFYMELSKIL
jgi:hypothetical protein